MSVKKKMAPPTTHTTALLGDAIILNILSVHDRFVNMMAMFDTINVVNAIARTSLALKPR